MTSLSFQLYLTKLGRTEPTRVLTRAFIATTLGEVGELVLKDYPKYKVLELQVFDNVSFSTVVRDTQYELALQRAEREKEKAELKALGEEPS